MGVPGLWKELQSHGCDTALARLSELKLTSSSTSSSTKSITLRLGIDVSSWLFHAQKSIGGHNPQLRLLFYRLCRLLAVPDVLPVFVFDGPLRPKEKRGKVTQTYREVAFTSDLKHLIAAFGFVVYDALGEAEAEMARMIRNNLLDAVMSDDVDCFVFGATLVIRNWGQDLSGSKARTGYVAEQSASEGCSASSADEYALNERQPLSAKDRLALGNNLVTYFRLTSLKDKGITQAGLILVAILSGGDYDVQGLPRCGAKISLALARAGFGDSLIDGLKKYCTRPVQPDQSSRLGVPEASESWPSFLAEWREGVRQELSTNESGHLGKRFKKLAGSSEFAELLSTNASMSVLGSYVWPLTTKSSSIFQSGAIDIAKIGQLCQELFHWTAPHTLETFRNNLWQGCAVRELSGESIFSMKRAAIKTKSSTKRVGTDNGNISTFFIVRNSAQDHSLSDVQGNKSVVLSIAAERESGSTGYIKEARVVCNVKAYVDLAKDGLDFNLSFYNFEEGEVPPSSQSTTSSPRKRKPLTEPEKELRMWIAQDLIKRDIQAARELERYHRKKTTKVDTPANQRKNTIKQGRLDTFFLGGKANATKVSPLKRRAPLQTSSQSSLSSAPSRSPSPTFQSPIKSSNRMQATKQTTNRISAKENNDHPHILAWDNDILNHSSSDEEENSKKTHNNDIYDFNDDSTLSAIKIPTTGKQNTLQSYPADDSVEFIRAKVLPARAKDKNTSSMAIEVSDDSDEG